MIVTLLVVNGIVQGMGAPPCSIVMTKWFSKKERGTKTGLWNISHNVGGMLVPPLVGIGVGILVKIIGKAACLFSQRLSQW